MPIENALLYHKRYGGSERSDKANRMKKKLPPVAEVEGLPPPGPGPKIGLRVKDTFFDGYVEMETFGNAEKRFRKVRSQRNSDCETYAEWQTDRFEVYTVALSENMKTALTCNCPDDSAVCKHMMLVEAHMETVERRFLRRRAPNRR